MKSNEIVQRIVAQIRKRETSCFPIGVLSE